MSFKDTFILALVAIFSAAEQNVLCNFGRGNYDEQFCEIILN